MHYLQKVFRSLDYLIKRCLLIKCDVPKQSIIKVMKIKTLSFFHPSRILDSAQCLKITQKCLILSKKSNCIFVNFFCNPSENNIWPRKFKVDHFEKYVKLECLGTKIQMQFSNLYSLRSHYCEPFWWIFNHYACMKSKKCDLPSMCNEVSVLVDHDSWIYTCQFDLKYATKWTLSFAQRSRGSSGALPSICRQ